MYSHKGPWKTCKIQALNHYFENYFHYFSLSYKERIICIRIPIHLYPTAKLTWSNMKGIISHFQFVFDFIFLLVLSFVHEADVEQFRTQWFRFLLIIIQVNYE